MPGQFCHLGTDFGGGALGWFILHRSQLFRVLGANPVPWDVSNKTMPFSNKNCFYGSRTRNKILNIMGGAKKIKFLTHLHIRVYKIRLDERIPKLVSKLNLDNI